MKTRILKDLTKPRADEVAQEFRDLGWTVTITKQANQLYTVTAMKA